MRTIFLCLLTTLMISCKPSVQKTVEPVIQVPDTVYVEVPVINQERIKELESDVQFWKHKVDSLNTTIPYEDYMNARRMEKVKYYISICEKKPSNKKFFYGWIKRTMSEK